MKTFARSLLLLTAATCIAGVGLADSTLEQFGEIEGRSYHERFYETESCDVCHESNEPVTFPADDVCLSCHNLDRLVETTARPDGEEGQNPHDNLHYGKDVPCMECHGEHESRQHMCDGCHSFEYPDFKP